MCANWENFCSSTEYVHSHTLKFASYNILYSLSFAWLPFSSVRLKRTFAGPQNDEGKVFDLRLFLLLDTVGKHPKHERKVIKHMAKRNVETLSAKQMQTPKETNDGSYYQTARWRERGGEVREIFLNVDKLHI